MNIEKQSQEQQSRRIDSWLERLEQKAIDLLDQIDSEELTARARADFAIKLLGQMARLMALRQQCQPAAPEDESSAMLSALMRQMRGEDCIVGP